MSSIYDKKGYIKSVSSVLAVPRAGLFPIVRNSANCEVEILTFRDGHLKCLQSLACLFVLSRKGDSSVNTSSYVKCVLLVDVTRMRTKTFLFFFFFSIYIPLNINGFVSVVTSVAD